MQIALLFLFLWEYIKNKVKMPKNVFLDDGLNYSGSTLNFNLYRNGVLVQDGFMTAYDFPIKIYLNRYAQPFLGNNFPGVEQGVVADPDASGVFDMQDLSGSTVVSETYISAYAGDFNELMAEPIDGKADPRQKIYITQYSATAGTKTITVQ